MSAIDKPKYVIRGVALYSFESIAAFVDFLMPESAVCRGILIAINAEKILAAERDCAMRMLLDQAEYKYPDGISIVRSIRKKYPGSMVKRIAGVDLWEVLMERAGLEGTPVFIIGSRQVVLEATCNKLRCQWNVNIVGTQNGYFSSFEHEALFARIRASGAKIVTVALGSPRQELFIAACWKYYSDALYMGVGGTYDVFIGQVKRAPRIWQRLGIEWLYRLIRQPKRLRRQVKLLKYQGYYWRGEL